jgi:hypothetical protein
MGWKFRDDRERVTVNYTMLRANAAGVRQHDGDPQRWMRVLHRVRRHRRLRLGRSRATADCARSSTGDII